MRGSHTVPAVWVREDGYRYAQAEHEQGENRQPQPLAPQRHLQLDALLCACAAPTGRMVPVSRAPEAAAPGARTTRSALPRCTRCLLARTFSKRRCSAGSRKRESSASSIEGDGARPGMLCLVVLALLITFLLPPTPGDTGGVEGCLCDGSFRACSPRAMSSPSLAG